VPQAIESASGRLVAFEMQLGPFAVAQLRIYAELIELIGKPPRTAPRMFVTDTLGNPFAEVAHAKHLRNLYVYFWRWATWKVFDREPKNDTGIVCFITVAARQSFNPKSIRVYHERRRQGIKPRQ